MNLNDREYKASTSVLEIKILNPIEIKIRSMETKSQTANTSVLEKKTSIIPCRKRRRRIGIQNREQKPDRITKAK